MTTQYSILSVLIRSEIQEKISIGLLLFDNNEVFFSYSRKKLNASKYLLSNSSFKILKDILENIERKIEADNSNYSEKKGFKIFQNKVFDNTFSSSYVSYLSRYSNNVISFTNPKEIHLDVSSLNFKKLYIKYVDDIIEYTETVAKAKLVEVIKGQYGDKIKEHYDIQIEVTPEIIPNLINTVRVDFIGRNGIDVYAQTVDMEAKPSSVSNHINAFVQLKSTYEENNVPIKDFIIAQEPEKQKFPKQHNIWEQLRASNVLNYLDLSQSEEIIKYAEENGVVPLSKVAE